MRTTTVLLVLLSNLIVLTRGEVEAAYSNNNKNIIINNNTLLEEEEDGNNKNNNNSSADSNTTQPVETEPDFNRTIYFVKPHPECTTMVLRSELDLLFHFKWWVNGVLTIVVAAFGFTGNVISVTVLMQRKMRNSFNQLLVALCVFDTIFILCNVLNSGTALGINKGLLSSVSRYSDVLGQVSMTASVLMIVAFTFERHFAIRSPHQYRIHIRTTPRWKHLSYYIVPVTFLSFFFNIPMFINLQRSWMTNPLYVKINLWLRVFHPLTTTGFAPILILVVLNVRICKGILLLHQRRTNRNAKEINMTYIAIAIVSLFVASNLPRIALGFNEVVHTKVIIRCIEARVNYVPSLFFFRADSLARLLMIVNSSVNFLVYSGGSTAFKEVFLEKFVPSACQPYCPGGGGVSGGGGGGGGVGAAQGHNTDRTQKEDYDDDDEDEDDDEAVPERVGLATSVAAASTTARTVVVSGCSSRKGTSASGPKANGNNKMVKQSTESSCCSDNGALTSLKSATAEKPLIISASKSSDNAAFV